MNTLNIFFKTHKLWITGIVVSIILACITAFNTPKFYLHFDTVCDKDVHYDVFCTSDNNESFEYRVGTWIDVFVRDGNKNSATIVIDTEQINKIWFEFDLEGKLIIKNFYLDANPSLKLDDFDKFYFNPEITSVVRVDETLIIESKIRDHICIYQDNLKCRSSWPVLRIPLYFLGYLFLNLFFFHIYKESQNACWLKKKIFNEFWQENKYCVLYALLVCGVMFVFFHFFQPIIIYDTDDWELLSEERTWLPEWQVHNPSRVLPVKLMRLTCSLAGWLVLHNVDFISAVSMVTEILVCMFIGIYFFAWGRFLKKLFNDNFQIFLTLILIFVLHFSAYRLVNNCYYMFWSFDLTGYYYYLIPALLNTSLVLYFITDGISPNSLSGTLLRIICIYFAIFSNEFHSYILAAYIIWHLLRCFFKTKFGCKEIGKYLFEEIWSFAIIILFAISGVFEMSGDNANDIWHPFFSEISENLYAMIEIILTFNPIFLLIITISSGIMIWRYMKNKLENNELFIDVLMAGCINILIIFVITCFTGSKYIYRADVAFGSIFYLFLLSFIALKEFMVMSNRAKFIPGILLIIFITSLACFQGKFFGSNLYGVTPEQRLKIDNFIIDQVLAAEKEGKKHFEILVPRGVGAFNWPHVLCLSEYIIRTLVIGNVVKERALEPELKPDIKINEQFNLPY